MLNVLVTTPMFILVGATGIGLRTNLPVGAAAASGQTWDGDIGRFFQPVLGPIGMGPQLTVSLFFGFIAKEILWGPWP